MMWMQADGDIESGGLTSVSFDDSLFKRIQEARLAEDYTITIEETYETPGN